MNLGEPVKVHGDFRYYAIPDGFMAEYRALCDKYGVYVQHCGCCELKLNTIDRDYEYKMGELAEGLVLRHPLRQCVS